MALNVLTLSNRRIFIDLIYIYKILNNLDPVLNCQNLILLPRKSNLRGGGHKLKQKLIKYSKLKQEFSSCTINQWNSLPDNMISSPTLAIFRRLIMKHLYLLQIKA